MIEASRNWTRDRWVVSLAGVGLLALLGCGWNVDRTEHAARAPMDTSAADTVRVIVAGREIVVPAPAGMIDVLTVTGRGPDRRPSGDVVHGVFIPRARLAAVLAGPPPRDLSVLVLVAEGNTPDDSSNTARFETLRATWLQKGKETPDPEGHRIAEVLGLRRQGAQIKMAEPLVGREGDRVVVSVDNPDDRSIRLLTAGRDPAAEGGGTDVVCDVRMLVRGRIMTFRWTERPFSVQALDEIGVKTQEWTNAVIRANS